MSNSPRRTPNEYTIQRGVSVVRDVQETPQLLAVTRQMSIVGAKYTGVRIRDFNTPTGEYRIRIPNLRLVHSAEVRDRLAHLQFPAETALLPAVLGRIETAAPHIFEEQSSRLRYNTVAVSPGAQGRNQWHINLSPDEATTKYLEDERNLVLQGLMDAIDYGDTDLRWPPGNFDITLATTPSSNHEEAIRRVANIALSRGPLEITLNPAQFSPDPRLMIH